MLANGTHRVSLALLAARARVVVRGLSLQVENVDRRAMDTCATMRGSGRIRLARGQATACFSNSDQIVIGHPTSKDLEFARLAAVCAGDERLPVPPAVTSEAEDPQQHALDVLRERCLLYVACTRTRDALVVTSVGAASGLVPGWSG